PPAISPIADPCRTFGILVFYHIVEESVKKNQPMRDEGREKRPGTRRSDVRLASVSVDHFIDRRRRSGVYRDRPAPADR
ncbi:hypothetical protein ACC785_38035, partial [Rhizobium ruizarguesonis]